MSAVAIIPARGGSRRIPRKNYREFLGKPILAYSVDVALESMLFEDGVWVSAEEADWGEIGIAAPRAGWIRRYPAFARDEVGTQEVMRHALQTMEGERVRELAALGRYSPMPAFVCCVYATAPTMMAVDLRRGYSEMRKREDYAYIHGWFYWGRTQWFLEGRPLGEEMPRPPDRWIDINTEDDWQRAETMYQAWQESITKETA